MDRSTERIARQSALIYLPIALGAALLFFLAAGWSGSYALVIRLGGAAWVGLLTLIIAMPLVTSRVKKQGQRNVEIQEEG